MDTYEVETIYEKGFQDDPSVTQTDSSTYRATDEVDACAKAVQYAIYHPRWTVNVVKNGVLHIAVQRAAGYDEEGRRPLRDDIARMLAERPIAQKENALMSQPRRKFVYEATMTVTLEADNLIEAQAGIDAIVASVKPADPESRYWMNTMVLAVSDVSKPGRKVGVRRAS